MWRDRLAYNLKPLLALSGQGPRLWGRTGIIRVPRSKPVIVTPPIEDYSKELQAAAAEMKAIPDPCPRELHGERSTTMAICGGVHERQKMSDKKEPHHNLV